MVEKALFQMESNKSGFTKIQSISRNKLQSSLSLKDFNQKVLVCYSNTYICMYRMGFVA